ncbi:MAG TPA: response regulator, partial [Candidatus Sulfotelmatobacter sp.]|nr:response regulator [Candidatus Sulfotelmatobacter sp.]
GRQGGCLQGHDSLGCDVAMQQSKEARQTMNPSSPITRGGYHKTILVVEDDPNDQVFIVQAFRACGVTNPIHTVGSGAEAIQYLMGEGQYADREQFAYPTFITLDLKMPGADGFTVLEHLKSNPQWAVIPVVILSASEDPDDIKKAYMLGASCYHVKPQDYAALCQQLKVLHDYWTTCSVPEVDLTGRQVPTESRGKLGERYPQPSGGQQTRQ